MEETVTVTGASPVVDVQNVVQQEVLTAEILDTLPIAKSLASFVAVVPGLKVGVTYANSDVGGTTGDRPIGTSIHGSRAGDQHVYYNGQRTNNINASAASTAAAAARSRSTSIRPPSPRSAWRPASSRSRTTAAACSST